MKYKHVLCVFVSIAFLAVGCGDPIPIKEMVAAKKSISKALSVKADKYAPSELEEANKQLFTCHDNIKKDDLDKAKAAAIESEKKGIEAYNKAVPLLAKDTIDMAEKSYEESTELFAEKLAKEDYDKAGAAIKKANEQFANKKFYESYLTALEANKLANSAKNTAIGRKDTLQDSITDVEYTLEKAEKYNSAVYSSEKYKLAKENLALAKESFGDNKLKKGFAAIEVAKINAEEAYQEAIAGTAKSKISEAEVAVAKAESSEGAGVAKDELAASKEMLDSSRTMYSESKYKESIEFADESVKLATIVEGTKKSVKTETTETETEITEVEGEKDFRQYKVKMNDYLRKISTRYYKNEMLWKHIYRENKDKIKNPNLIYPGWILKVPKLDK